MIRAENISVGYQNNVIIQDISFSATSGEKICLYGPSGGGKTTLINSIIGFADIISGTMHINGMIADDNTIGDIRKQISWLPQNIYLPVSNGKELLNFYLNVKDLTHFKSFLKYFGLGHDILNRDLQEISGGQKQRLMLSACLSLKRKILLLDEPTSALDNESVEKIIDVIFKLKDITVISTSHNPLWINRCDKIYEIKA